MANQDSIDATSIGTTITTLQGLTVGSAGSDGQIRDARDVAGIAQHLADEKKRKLGPGQDLQATTYTTSTQSVAGKWQF